jgi:hypothetical protein
MAKIIGKWSRAGMLLLSMFAFATSPVVAQKKQLLEYPSIHSPVVGEQGMVVSQNAIASEVGADILSRGGNAVDVAKTLQRLSAIEVTDTNDTTKARSSQFTVASITLLP